MGQAKEAKARLQAMAVERLRQQLEVSHSLQLQSLWMVPTAAVS